MLAGEAPDAATLDRLGVTLESDPMAPAGTVVLRKIDGRPFAAADFARLRALPAFEVVGPLLKSAPPGFRIVGPQPHQDIDAPTGPYREGDFAVPVDPAHLYTLGISERPKRLLAANVAADVAGYSRS